MFRYGFELEGFFRAGDIPPENFPVDGFPGLIEIRTVGHHTLDDAIGLLLSNILAEPVKCLVNWSMHEHTFTPEQKRALRKKGGYKAPADVQNIYGKKPKSLGNKTIASFQINVSNLVSHGFTDTNGKHHPDVFSLLDVPKIVKSLDKEFMPEIKAAKRQPGEYCIKGDRLEYRSLPNGTFPPQLHLIPHLVSRIRKAVEQ